MWSLPNFRQIKAVKRDRLHKRKTRVKVLNCGDYWNSSCELELRYYIGILLRQELNAGILYRGRTKKSSFVPRNKRLKIVSVYAKKFNHPSDETVILANRIDQKKYLEYRRMFSVGHPCLRCDGCYITESKVCRIAQGRILHKYGFFRYKAN
jgi:hypothetical protein